MTEYRVMNVKKGKEELIKSFKTEKEAISFMSKLDCEVDLFGFSVNSFVIRVVKNEG